MSVMGLLPERWILAFVVRSRKHQAGSASAAKVLSR
jgi:hypothetical protein